MAGSSGRPAPLSPMLLLVASFAVAFILQMMAMPAWVEPLRPDWPALVLIYWALALPQRVGPGVGWLVGLWIDLARATTLGTHALASAVLAYVVVRFHLRIRSFPWWQQALVVFVFLFLYRALVSWIRSFLGDFQPDHTYWYAPLTGTLIWPWLFIVLRDVRRSARLS